jgi:hypothetical protein
MATAKVIPFGQSAQAVPAVEPISQLRLELVLSLRNRVRQVQVELEKQETELRNLIEAGAPIEPGEHTAIVKENLRRNVSWKDVTIRLADRLKLDGEAYCARVLAATKPSKTTSLEIN